MPNTPAEVRSSLIDALQLDLVGPTPNDIAHVDEIIDQAPSKWYLTGFLVPYEASVEQRSEDIGNDDIDEISQVNAGDDEKQPDSASARRAFFPSSMGLSILVPATAKEISVTVHWGDYCPVDEENEENQEDSKNQLQLPRLWQRTPGQAELTVPLHVSNAPKHWEIPGSNGLRLVTSVRPVTAAELVPAGTRSISVFLVNYRPPAANPYSDIAFAFQTCLIIRTPYSLVPRPNLRGRHGDDWDEKVADLQYRDDYEYAVGHNVSAVAVTNDDTTCQEVRTAWMPIADVEKVVPEQVAGVELGMEALAAAPTVETLRNMMSGIVDAYGLWIEAQKLNLPSEPERLEVANDLLNRASRANKRIAAGLQALDDPNVLEAFQIANRAIAIAIRQRSTHNTDITPESVKPPAWRPFQLAFLLMNLVGIAHPEHSDRELVDLLFFPTGGGKTEAYLGLAAFAMVLRRLRNPTINASGVSVLMRYTLRLLTLDQLSRAATLVCALELERQKDTQKLGPWPFEIGLWVGQTATPNRMGKKGDNDEYTARARTIAFQNDTRKPSPIPLENCPWCGKRFTSDSFQLLPDSNQPKSLQITCINRKCKFTRSQSLPIVAVDEPIYQRLPSFIIATVDKFANLPWVGETGALFGLVDRYDKDGFYGPAHPGRGQALAGHLPAPDLIIQDELHLISGPLGTMVGLYETAIDELCSRQINGKKLRPKIIASTATVRRASKQIRALFGRDAVDIFPPPGPDRRDSFFAKTVPASVSNARTYVGIAAQGRSLKVVLLRTYLALLGAAQKHYQAAGGAKNPDNPADPYMTLLGSNAIF